MIVDDDDDVRSSLVDLLRDDGYRTRCARNGIEALMQLEAAPPDLILLDLIMPVMDGWTFRAIQLRTPELAQIPVVVMSGLADVETTADLVADAYLPKPTYAERVLGIVGALCSPIRCAACGATETVRSIGEIAFCVQCVDVSTDPTRDIGGEG
jgi:CheY-like chemotaxis protein